MASRLGLAEGWGKIHKLRFNQDQTLFTVAAQDGMRVFSVDPIRELAHFQLEKVGSVAHAEQHELSSTCCVVSTEPGGNNKPKYDPKVVMLFDSSFKKTNVDPKNNRKTTDIGKFRWELTVPDKVLSVRICSSKVIVVTKEKIFVYEFPGKCKYLYSIPTRENPLGLCEISAISSSASESKAEIMIFPGFETGSLQIVDLSTTELSVSQSPVTINAHKSDLHCIALNYQSTLIATASSKGTLIRIWSATSRQMLVELRRGTDQASLHCINFSSDDQWLCCSSDKGTVHIFALQDYKLNERSALATVGIPGAYAGSQWSLASFTVPQECPCICCFGKETGTVFAACLDGSFHKYHFTPEGQCNRLEYDVFTQMCEDCIWNEMRK